MTQIGQFTRDKSTFTGRIQTLFFERILTLTPVESSDAENAPDYRICLGDADGPEIGAGWTRTGEKAGEYVSLIIDDPTLPRPIRANLFQSGDDKSAWTLNWNRLPQRADRD
ncbi:DUF736 domain-containing protein [Bradyrhizobium elkanii]|jgi:uncharacterized protein (DUF736 family)|uniref:DUF736 domain-containing protein n=1 Tax=Bradyrhizobium elkanii TaxID=29448 RepID=UPI001449F937|nr:DUF736 domain-containing protein [Bradyrhizobium elkanii]MCP1927747.1 uncharacterized protein (DUF736 family) [Bradyrhizobium elkanii]MCS3581644.1 uncharacterized protein (DUF736 family) [Bradyrhizobium elkanii]MCS3724518.1 uncharacterized protein (DUF736 family) [Bradyrhizobium elkanii]MCS4008930.1 uncharacterized protein (DUF736 family) [Bradyrhizobium elkanii USDA 61]WLA40808.1 DUF736 domain-containing protein [Bradyrhizobium elkanii]